jgi:uncharacterized protein YbjQ (UPF0145 family)
MIVTTTENVAGHKTVESFGQAFGVVVRSRGLGGNIIAGLRTIIGGEIYEYTALVEETRRQAVDRLVRNASAMGANAVVMMRFDSGALGQTMNEVVAYDRDALTCCARPRWQSRSAFWGSPRLRQSSIILLGRWSSGLPSLPLRLRSSGSAMVPLNSGVLVLAGNRRASVSSMTPAGTRSRSGSIPLRANGVTFSKTDVGQIV